jgi:hypothetical protein
MNAAEATELLSASLPPDRLRQVLVAFGQRQVGDICRWDGEHWEALTGPEAEEEGSAAFSAVYDLLIALEDQALIEPRTSRAQAMLKRGTRPESGPTMRITGWKG